MPPRPYEEILDRTLVESDKLQARIKELGAQISKDYADTENLILVGILKGCLLFFADIMRNISVPHEIDFMDVTSYGTGARSTTGDVRILMDLSRSIKGSNVLIIEDIIDSGHTMDHVLRLLHARQPESLRICTLLDKRERREIDIPLDYIGFEIPDCFVFGYGLDIDEYYRNLPFIGVVKDGVFLGDV